MPSPITEEAIRIIEAAPKHGPLRPAEYARTLLPEGAALSRVLSDKKIQDAAERYHAADQAAVGAQARFMRLAWASACSGFLAALLGGVLLYVGPEPSKEVLRANLGLAQFVFLLLSLLCAFALFVLKPYRTWRTSRGDAEAMRLQVFALMMSGWSEPRQGEVPLLPLQLECFRRHLLHDQRDFFARRWPQQRRTVRIWKMLGAIALLLVLGASLPQLLRLEPFGLLPDVVKIIISQVPLDQNGYALAGLFGGSLQTLLAALTVISPAQRNAEKYQEMFSCLDDYSQANLDNLRAAAAVGDSTAVGGLTRRVSSDLAEEAREWLLLQEVLSEMTLRQLANQKIA